MKDEAPKNQIIGLVRFSYPAKNGFRRKFDTFNEARSALYAPERMELRFSLLEKMCVHSMRHQTDQNFRLVFMIGDQMPKEYIARLEDIIAAIHGAVILPMRPVWMYKGTRTAFASVVEKDSDYVTAFRLDDDDAVAVDYVAQTRAKANALIMAGLVNKPTVLSYTNGLYLDVDEQTKPFTHIRERTPLGLACAMVTTPDLPETVFGHNHRQYGRFVQTIMDPEEIMFIRLIHGFNDSGDNKPRNKADLNNDEVDLILQTRFRMRRSDLIQ